MPPFQPNELIAILTSHQVDFVVIGGIAAVLHGAPYTTFDLDVVYSRTEENLLRLEAVLVELDAEVYDLTDRHLKVSRAHLEALGPKFLRTRYGRLDIRGQLDDATDWDQLLADAEVLPYGKDTVHVLRLEQLIEVKERLARDKDHAALPLLRATLARRSEGERDRYRLTTLTSTPLSRKSTIWRAAARPALTLASRVWAPIFLGVEK